MATYLRFFPWIYLPMGICLSVVRFAFWREPNMAGANACYAARGTQDLTWEVPKSGNTRPRV